MKINTGYAHGYDSSQSQTLPPKYYQDTYSHLESPEKVNSLERNKKSHTLQPLLNDLDSSVYGTTNNNYGPSDYSSFSNYNSFSQNAPKFSPSYGSNQYSDVRSNFPKVYESLNATINSKPYEPLSTSTPSHYATLNKGYGTTTSPKPFTTPTQDKSFDYDTISHNLGNQYQSTDSFSKSDHKPSSDGYSSSEYVTNTYKTPGGYKTNTFKYESYQSAPQQTYSSSSEKYYSSSPAGKPQPISPPSFDKKSFDAFKNGSDSQYQSSYSTNVEYVNQPPMLKDEDTLEQKMLKKSVTQQIIEKKTVSMTKSSKHESSTKSFKFD